MIHWQVFSSAQGLRFPAVLLIIGLGLWPAQGSAQSPSEARRYLMLWQGSLPIILAAPHGGSQSIPGVAQRLGVGVSQFITERDSNTMELAETVARQLDARLGAKPFLVAALFARKFIDVNRPAAAGYESALAKPYYDAYHQALEEAAERLRETWGGGLLLDIHGQGAETNAIFRGTDNGKSVALLRQRYGKEALSGAKSILGQMAERGYKVLPDGSDNDRERRYSGGYTTQSYGSHRGTKIDAIQLEFGTNLRRRANLPRTASDLAHAIEIFAREYLPVRQTDGTAAPRP